MVVALPSPCTGEKRPPQCLADQLYTPFRILVTSPSATFVIFVIAYSVFAFNWLVLRLLISIFTKPGVAILVLLFIYTFLYYTSLTLSYPGRLHVAAYEANYNYGLMLASRIDTALTTLETLRDSTCNKFQRMHDAEEVEYQMNRVVIPLYNAMKNMIENTNSSHRRRVVEFYNVLSLLVSEYHSSVKPILEERSSISESFFNTVQKLKVMVRDNVTIIKVKPEDMSVISSVKYSFFESRKERQQNYVASFDLLRSYLQVEQNGVSVSIKSKNNIDGMWIPSATNQKSQLRTVVLCNPNAGYYEFHPIQTDWIDFYTKTLESNVFIYNYRGYGRSTEVCKIGGTISPSNNVKDGISVIEFLQQSYNVTEIAIHGESIGGMAAVGITASSSSVVKLVIADRTFSTLPILANELTKCCYAGRALSIVTQWSRMNVVEEYLALSVFKICCCDPEDEVIYNNASLKAGVALVKLFSSPALVSNYSRRESTTTCSRIEVMTEDVMTEFYYALIDLQEIRDDDNGNDTSSNSITITMDEENDNSNSTLIMLWEIVSSIQNPCENNQTLLQALNGGYNDLRVWVATYVVFGNQFKKKCSNSSIMSVANLLRKIDTTDSVVFQMIYYIEAAICRSSSNDIVGHLLPLTCGHNSNPSEVEKIRLRELITQSEWWITTSSST